MNKLQQEQLIYNLTDCVYSLLCVVGQDVEADSDKHKDLCKIEDKLVTILELFRE